MKSRLPPAWSHDPARIAVPGCTNGKDPSGENAGLLSASGQQDLQPVKKANATTPAQKDLDLSMKKIKSLSVTVNQKPV